MHDHTLTIAAPGVLFNDIDPAGLPLTAVPETAIATLRGGTVTLNADGSFTYTPRLITSAPTRSLTSLPTAASRATSATVTIAVTETAPVARNDTTPCPTIPRSTRFRPASCSTTPTRMAIRSTRR